MHFTPTNKIIGFPQNTVATLPLDTLPPPPILGSKKSGREVNPPRRLSLAPRPLALADVPSRPDRPPVSLSANAPPVKQAFHCAGSSLVRRFD
jgi:hypothetical protein